MQTESTRLLIKKLSGETAGSEVIHFKTPSLSEATKVVEKLFATGYATIQEYEENKFKQI